MVNKLTGLEGGLEVGQKINEIIDAKADVNADTTGNAGTATKLANARTITLSGDVSGSFSFDGSVNKTVTTTLNNTTKIDGQWVSKTETLSTATAVGTYTIDLSSYLPDDNYNYDINVHFAGYRNSGDTNSNISISSEPINTVYDLNNLPSSMFAFSSFDGNHAECGNFSAILHIGTNRKFYFNIVQAALKMGGLYAYAYRRIGTNT